MSVKRKSFELVGFDEQARKSKVETSWNLCFICQDEEDSEIIKPFNNPKFKEDPKLTSYQRTAQQLKKFQVRNGLNERLSERIGTTSSVDDLRETFCEKRAIFHKRCTLEFSESRYKRKFGNVVGEKSEDAIEQRTSRSRVNAKNFTSTCFFCEKDGDLHECQTLYVDARVRKIAQELRDVKTLAKLSEGDMVATEAKYHTVCLAGYYNRFRDHNAKKNAETKRIDQIKGMAFGEVVRFIEHTIRASDDDHVPVFKLVDIRSMYRESLLFHGASAIEADLVHPTRLKERILHRIPCLVEKKAGRIILLTLDEDMGRALFEACRNTCEDEGIILAEAAGIIRKKLFETNVTFNGDVSPKKQTDSVPSSLISLITLIMEGGNVNERSNVSTKVATNISQLIRFNSVKHKRKGTVSYIRHSNDNEPPLPVILALMLHWKTRKRWIVDKMAREGLCVQYNRVKTIQKNVSNQLIKKYLLDGLVCPHSLKPGLFTTAAIDNLDYNPSSTTSKDSVHVTSISIFQHPSEATSKSPFRLEEVSTATLGRKQLPEAYTEIKPTKQGKPEPPSNQSIDDNFPTVVPVYEEAAGWTEGLSKNVLTPEMKASFSSYHSQNVVNEQCISLNELLPLLPESVNSPAMVRHCMDTTTSVTNTLNPGQTVVITGDQPVYALGKQVQWMYETKYKELVWMMGPLHIEMMFLSCIGDWLKGSGWSDIYEASKISTPGKIDSFLKGNKVKQSRYGHHVTLSALLTLAKEAFYKQAKYSSYTEWKSNLSKTSANPFYWFNVTDLEIIMFMFLKSLRDPNFDLFVRTLKEILPWTFALDHVHYARWLSVFIHDLLCLANDHPDILKQFLAGFFTVKKSSRQFSSMGIDQAHEQNNKKVKVDGGAIGIFDNENAMLDWSVASPVIADLVTDFFELDDACDDDFELGEPEEGVNTDKHDEPCKKQKHHEETIKFEKTFIENRDKLVSVFMQYGNPFEEEEKNLVRLQSRVVLSDEATKSVKDAHEIGIKAAREFTEHRLINKTVSFYDNITMNKLPLFIGNEKKKKKKGEKKIQALKEDTHLFSALYISSMSREGDLRTFFAHENHPYPVSISEYGRLRPANSKSDFISIIESLQSPSYVAPVVDAMVFDGPGFVHVNPPNRTVVTYGAYAEQVSQKLNSLATDLSRLDVVFDVYWDVSLKEETRENRGATETRVSLKNETPLSHKNFSNVLKVGENKTSIFNLIAESVAAKETDTLLVSTKESDVVSNKSQDTTNLAPCNQEEADTRIFLHVLDASKKGCKKVSVVANDTDVVVIAISVFPHLDLEELWVEFGTGINKKWLPVHTYANLIGAEKCRAIPFWYAFTGCDTVSQFNGVGKKTAWKTWSAYPEATETFIKLSGLSEVTEDDFDIIQRFVILMYERSSSLTSVNECRRKLFTKNRRALENIPPSEDALMQHLKRAMLQAFIWVSCLLRQLPEIDYSKWGWVVDENGVHPLWQTLAEAAKACVELRKCTCKKRCNPKICKCLKYHDMKCTQLCACDGGCYDNSN